MSRLFHVVKRSRESSKLYDLVGVFTNKKLLLESLETLDVENCYIKGARKNKIINTSSLATGFELKTCNIYKLCEELQEEYIEYRIVEIQPNLISPEFNQVSSEFDF